MNFHMKYFSCHRWNKNNLDDGRIDFIENFVFKNYLGGFSTKIKKFFHLSSNKKKELQKKTIKLAQRGVKQD